MTAMVQPTSICAIPHPMYARYAHAIAQISVSAPRTFPYTPLFRSMMFDTGARAGLLEGDLGMSFQYKQPVSKIIDRKSTRLNSSHVAISYAVFCLKKKKKKKRNKRTNKPQKKTKQEIKNSTKTR